MRTKAKVSEELVTITVERDSENDESSALVNPTLESVERAVILKTFEARNRNRTHTAQALNIGIRTLQRKLKEYGVE